MQTRAATVNRMAELVNDFDWATTPLGSIRSWPQSLETAVDIVLSSGHAMQLAWGPERTVIYNDAYAPMLGSRHPSALGHPFRDAWPDIWEEIQPLVARVFAGETVRFEAMPLVMTRHGYPEQTWWTFSYSPVRDETGAVAGLLNVTVDATPQVRAQSAERERDEGHRLRAAMLEVLPIGLALIGTDGKVISSNSEWDRFTPGGHLPSRDADRGWRWRALDCEGRIIEPNDYPGARALRGERCIPGIEFLYTADSGAQIWANVASVPLFGSDNRVTGAVSIIVDIDAAKRTEAALRENEQRQAFLLELSDAVRSLSDAEEIRLSTATMLGVHLHAARVAYAEDLGDGETYRVFRNYVDGAPDLSGLFRYVDYGADILSQLQAGENRVQPDIANDSRLSEVERQALAAAGIGASMNVPLIKSGRLAAFIGVNFATAHDFTPREISLVEEVAERAWAAVERARAEVALRDSEQRFRALLTAGTFSIYRMSPDWRIMYQLDSQTLANTTEPIEDWVGKYILDEDLPRVRAAIDRAIDTKSLFELEHRVRIANGGVGWVLSRAVPLLGADGEIIEWFGAGSDVTARREAIERLRESEGRFRALAQTSPLGVGVSSAEGRIIYANRAYEAMLGYEEGELLGQPSTVVYFESPDRRKWLPAVEQGEALSAHEVRFKRKDGTPIWVSINVAPIQYDGRQAIIGVTQNVTERRRIEEALRDSEERLRQFGEASQDVLWIRDAETLQWQYLTPAFETIYGLSRQEVLAGNNYRSWIDLIVPEDRAQAMEHIRRVRDGEHVTFDFRIKRPADGTIRWLRNTDFPILDSSGAVSLIGGIGHDLTGLREMELRLQNLIEGIPQLVWRAVGVGSWTWASPQWTGFTGLSEFESRGWGWLNALHPEDRAVAKDAWAHAIDNGGFEVEYRLCHASVRDYRWFKTRATPVRSDSGEIVEWLGTSTDIHELRTSQDLQRVLVGELQHRTRNLMGVVQSLAERTADGSSDFADFRGRFGDRLDALARVQSLLSRIHVLDRVAFDELIRAELTALDGATDRVTLSGPAGIRLRSSTVQTLAMAIHELATNAVKYGALGQPDGRINISWHLTPLDRDGRPRLHIDWRESGVKMLTRVSSSQRSGQGRELIEEALPYQLQAQTLFELGPEGLHCTITVPVSSSNLTGAGHD